jgi:hypothetical protein
MSRDDDWASGGIPPRRDQRLAPRSAIGSAGKLPPPRLYYEPYDLQAGRAFENHAHHSS